MSLFSKFLGIFKEEENRTASALSSMSAQPIQILWNDDETLRQAKYRIGAIMRHVQQTKEEGREIVAAKMKHFELEFAELRAKIERLEAAKEGGN